MEPLSVFAPAKLNLFLAITGRRADGFHDLVSVVAQLAIGDTLTVTPCDPAELTGDRFALTCSDPDVPCDGSNLVLRAAHAFAMAARWAGAATFHLEKRTPMGAGMGGGSSDGAAALRALNQLAGHPLTRDELSVVAASLGSDCPLFLEAAPVVMRGRGERVERLGERAAARLHGCKVLVFKPAFAVPTAWAYRRMAEIAAAGGAPDAVYLPSEAAERRLKSWLDDADAPVESLLFNNLERPAFEKFVALPALLEQLCTEFGLAPRMTGSGSACFALLPVDAPVTEITAAIRSAWGDSAYVVATQLA
jgi:4-diphosphocytidyl-2-C-methyl-D-erythritol kinase